MDYLVHHLLQASASRFPEKEALVHGGKRLSYQELEGKTKSLAQGLRRAGIERAQRVGVFLEPSVAQAVSLLGISQAGGVFVPIHPGLFPQQVAHIMRDCGMSGLITDAARLHRLKPEIDNSPSLEVTVSVGSPSQSTGSLRNHSFSELCGTEAPPRWSDTVIDKDLAAIIYTSGSTGRPKGVMLSHANIIAGAAIVAEYLELSEHDRTLAALPFSFDAGLNQLMTSVRQGGTLVLIDFLFARDIVQSLSNERITGLAGVPTLWSLLAQRKSGLVRHTFPHLRYITNTGGAMPLHLVRTLREVLATTKIYLMYGLTEAFRSTYLPPDQIDRRPDSIGKAIPNTEILVVNHDGKPCRPGEIGELAHRGPTVSMGYWGRPDLSAEILRPYPFSSPGVSPEEKVCYSGDLVKMDDEGFLYFVGRRDNLIKSMGFRVSPTEIEELLCRHGAVHAAAVVGIPHDIAGQRIKAFVTLRDGAEVEPDALRAFCAEHLPAHMVPFSVEIRDGFPTTSTGKVDYTALRDPSSRAAVLDEC